MTDQSRIDMFRELVRQLKKATIEGVVFETQDVKVLNEVTGRLAEIFVILRDALKGKRIENPELAALFTSVLDPPSITPEEAVDILYYLRRDLIMFPLTLDTERINSVSENNSTEEVEYGGA